MRGGEIMDNVLNVALPKGRLGEKVYSLFEKAGYECPSIHENNRKLIFENDCGDFTIRYFWVKPLICPLLCLYNLRCRSLVTLIYSTVLVWLLRI